jgi:hypothetical protein
MFSDLTGSFGEIMATVPAGKTGRIDGGYGNSFIGRVKQVRRFSEGEPEIECFYPTKKFQERCEMKCFGEIKNLLDFGNIFNIFDEFPVVLVYGNL